MIADLDGTMADLREDESEVLHAYRDHLGFLTIGVGRLIDERRGGGISTGESAMLLTNDITGRVAILETVYPWFSHLDPVRQSAFTNLAFNLGVDGLAHFKNTLAAAARSDWPAVVQGLTLSKWHGQVQPSRRERIKRMIREGHR